VVAGARDGDALVVDDLRVEFATPAGPVAAVRGARFRVGAGEVLGLVGQSGSGKTVTAAAILGLLAPPGRVVGGRVWLRGVDLLALAPRDRRRGRGVEVFTVFQSPGTVLDPTMRVGPQVAEALERRGADPDPAAVRALLTDVRLDPDTDRRYPFELSGGMRQRVLIAMALALEPRLLIADEPTTGLDTVTQAEILQLLRTWRARTGSALLLISHDLPLVSSLADRVAVMHEGRVVDCAPTNRLADAARHPHTRQLLRADPLPPPPPPAPEPLLTATGLRRVYGDAEVLDGVDLSLARGETLGLVGGSGAGKSTLARCLAGLEAPDDGGVEWHAGSTDDRAPWQRVQVVWQDPHLYLNPYQRAAEQVAEPLRNAGLRDRDERRRRVDALLADVGLDAALAGRYPHQLSGGQCQRLAIARALAPQPEVVICDEALSGLDAPLRERILQLLRRLQIEHGLTYLFITHDLGLARRFCPRLAVLDGGRVVESGDTAALLSHPHRETTRRLVAALESTRATA
jgi:peptide/nickel transport system ATP-binding protein